MSNVNWLAIQQEYEAGGISLRQLARKHNVSKTYLIERRDKEKWNRPDRPPLEHRPTSGNSEPTTRDVNAAVRVHDAIKLFLEERPTWDEIAARTGYSSRGAAHHAVMRELDRCITHDVKELRTQELYRIEQVQARCYKASLDERNLGWTWAVDRFANLSKRKSELMGMDVKPEEQLTNQNYVKKIVLTHEQGGQDASPNS